MQLLPQPRHSFALIFTVLGFILLPSAWLCAISLASIHLGCMYQGRAALSMVCPVKPTLPKWLKPSVPPATCLLGSQQLQTQASFLAGLSHHSQLAQRMYLSPLQRGSSKTRGLPRTGRWRAAAAEPPHVHGHGVLSHQGSAILHAWIALQRPLGCHPVRPIYKSHNRFNFEISLSSSPCPHPPPYFCWNGFTMKVFEKE